MTIEVCFYFFFFFSSTLVSNFCYFLILGLFLLLGKCKFHPRLWIPSADKSVTVSCDAAIKSHPEEMAAMAFIVRDKQSIPLFAGVC